MLLRLIFLVVFASCGYPVLSALEAVCGGQRCEPQQRCAADQDVCIDLNGCGNGVVDPGESCDDGKLNGSAGGACDIHCHVVNILCGNGMVDLDKGEQCDPAGGADTAVCNGKTAGAVSCQASRCGDGYANGAAGELCDTIGGIDTPTCNGANASRASVRCQPTRCGDNYVNATAEDCDPGTGIDSSTCNGSAAGAASCHFPGCGDGYVNTKAGEQCDTLGGGDSSTCNGKNAGAASCQMARCGDGYINTADGEQCEQNADCTSGRTCVSCKCV